MNSKFKYAIRAARANFLPASIIPFLIGAAYAFKTNASVSASRFMLGITGVAAMHLAGNLFNDYFDYINGADNINREKSPFFGGSRVIQDGLLTGRDVLALAVFLMALSVLCGILICVVTGNPVFLLFMFIAGILAFQYTAPPLALAYHMLGEPNIFLLFGVFLVMGSSYLFTGIFSWSSFLISLPIAFLVTAIIICNEIPDYPSDVAAGKNNIISLAGWENGYKVYAAAVICSALALLLNIALGNLPQPAILIILFYDMAIRATAILRNRSSNMKDFIRSSALTVTLYSAVGSCILIALLVKR